MKASRALRLELDSASGVEAESLGSRICFLFSLQLFGYWEVQSLLAEICGGDYPAPKCLSSAFLRGEAGVHARTIF